MQKIPAAYALSLLLCHVLEDILRHLIGGALSGDDLSCGKTGGPVRYIVQLLHLSTSPALYQAAVRVTSFSECQSGGIHKGVHMYFLAVFVKFRDHNVFQTSALHSV